jgi:3-oxoacyl-[acyl-carrier-protein] synthase-3
MNAVIRDVVYALPAIGVSNDDLRAAHSEWDMDRIEKRTGVRHRFRVGPDETALDLGEAACRRLFAKHPELIGIVDALIFCTESPDHPIPPNSCILHGRLGLAEGVFSFDVDLGCSGYPYCLALARGLINNGTVSNVVLVTADTYSKFMSPEDQSVQVLFGDGGAATWLSAANTAAGIVSVKCGTAGSLYDKFIVRAGGCRMLNTANTISDETMPSGRPRRSDKIVMDGPAILAFTSAKIPTHIREFLAGNGLEVSDVDLFVFHQASQMVLDNLTRLLRLRPDQTFSNLSNIGNTVSASIPIALSDAITAGKLQPGATVVLCGFGLGLSWGSALLRWQ